MPVQMIPFMPYRPDQGPLSGDSTDVALNVIGAPNGYVPAPSPVGPTAALPSQCLGSWVVRTASGAYIFFAATQTNIYRLGAGGTWSSVGSGYTGPLPGDLWTAAKYGSRLYLSNEMDALQYIDVDSGSAFAAAPGSPPRAKFVCVIGDFLFLASLRIGASPFPQDWQHSAIDDPADWIIDGSRGASDRGTFPAGEEITGIMPRANNGGRIFQRNAKRALIFSPGGATAFEVRDIDPTNGVFAPYSVIDIGNDDYVYIHEQGVFRGDSHTPIGFDNISRTLTQPRRLRPNREYTGHAFLRDRDACCGVLRIRLAPGSCLATTSHVNAFS